MGSRKTIAGGGLFVFQKAKEPYKYDNNKN